MKNYKANPKNQPLVLMRKLAGRNVEVRIGDTILTPRGKTAIVTGWDEINNIVHAQSTCGNRYFISAPAGTFDCWFAEA